MWRCCPWSWEICVPSVNSHSRQRYWIGSTVPLPEAFPAPLKSHSALMAFQNKGCFKFNICFSVSPFLDKIILGQTVEVTRLLAQVWGAVPWTSSQRKAWIAWAGALTDTCEDLDLLLSLCSLVSRCVHADQQCQPLVLSCICSPGPLPPPFIPVWSSQGALLLMLGEQWWESTSSKERISPTLLIFVSVSSPGELLVLKFSCSWQLVVS